MHSGLSVLHRDVRLRLLNVLGRLTRRCKVFLTSVHHRLRRTFRLLPIKASIRHDTKRCMKEASRCQRTRLVRGNISILRKNRHPPFKLICAGTIRRNKRLIAIFNVISTPNTYTRGECLLHVRTRNGIVQCLAANESGRPIKVLRFRGVRRTLRNRLIRMGAITRIVIHERNFKIMICRSATMTFLTSNIRNLRTTPIRLCKEASTMNTKTRCSSKLIITRMASVVYHTTVH